MSTGDDGQRIGTGEVSYQIVCNKMFYLVPVYISEKEQIKVFLMDSLKSNIDY